MKLIENPSMSRPHRRRPSPEPLEDRRLLAALTVAPVTVDDSAASSGATFTAILAEASSGNVTLTYATSDGSAKAGRDYVATRSAVTIPAGRTSATFTVDIKPTNVAGKADEVFHVNLKAGAGDTVASRVAATIVDDLPKPTVTIADVTVAEDAGGGTTHASATVKLSAPSAKSVAVSYQTIDGTATSSGPSRDYKATKGAVTIKPGATSATIPLTIDDRAATDKTFEVELTGSAGGSLKTVPAGDLFARVVIHDTRSKATVPTLSISSPTVLAGHVASFDVTLSTASAVPVSVRYFSVDGTATTSGYSAVDGVLTIPAGQTAGVIAVPTIATTTSTEVQQFQIDLTSPANAGLAARSTLGTIVNASAEPTVSVTAPPATAAPKPGVAQADDFAVSLSKAFLFPVTVDYATVDGTAVAGTNYTATSGTLTFAPGVTSLTVPVTLLAPGVATFTTDPLTLHPPKGAPASTDVAFGLDLTNATDATIATGSATAVILHPEGKPSISVAPASLTVGTSGDTAALLFDVSLSAASADTIAANYATADGTAVSGVDYSATSGSVVFTPGMTSIIITVLVNPESSTVASRTMTFDLDHATNTANAAASAIGTINYSVLVGGSR